MFIYDFSTHGGIFYLRVKTREEGTPRHGIRRHVDFIDDHCHASCQMIFLPFPDTSIRGPRSLLLPSRSSYLVYHHVRYFTRRGQHVLLSIKCIYLHAPLRSTDIFRLFELHSTEEIIGHHRHWENLKLSVAETRAQRAASNFPYRSLWWRKITSAKTFLPRITMWIPAWRFLRRIGASRFSSSVQQYWIECIRRYLEGSIVLRVLEIYIYFQIQHTAPNGFPLQISLSEIPFDVYLGNAYQTIVFLATSNRIY